MKNEKQTTDDDTPEDLAFDALLFEAFEKSAAPDLARQILTRLRDEKDAVTVRSAVVGGAVVGSADVRGADLRHVDALSSKARSPERRRLMGVWMTLLAMAASVMAVLWLRTDRDVRVEVEGVAQKPTVLEVAELDDAPVQADAAKQEVIASSSPRRPRGEPKLLGTPAPSGNRAAMAGGTVAGDPPDAQTLGPPEPIRLVSSHADQQMRDYWSAIGIRPADTADASETADRLKHVLGVNFSATDIAGPDSIESRLADPSVAHEIAHRWLSQVTGGGVERLDPERRDKLIASLARSFAGQTPVDTLVAGWISGADPISIDFYQAMAGGADTDVDAAVARRLASLTMNVDLRCTRCHDAYIEGSGRQEDYWSLVSLLRQGRSDVKQTDERLFYDLPDGRKRLARPAVPSRWLGTSKDATSLADWSERLKGSAALSRGLVNSLWQLVHGEPLRGRVVDPMSAPHHEALAALESQLAEDMRRSQFNLGRTLALVIASPATSREVPASLENAWVIDNAKDRAAAEAFAAARPPKTALPLGRRLDEAMRAIGAKLGDDGSPLLAQIGDSGSVQIGEGAGDSIEIKSDTLSWDFPDRASTLPVQWLLPIKAADARIDHLGYLAGLDRVPEAVRQSAAAMKAADVDESTLLNRIWWMVR